MLEKLFLNKKKPSFFLNMLNKLNFISIFIHKSYLNKSAFFEFILHFLLPFFICTEKNWLCRRFYCSIFVFYVNNLEGSDEKFSLVELLNLTFFLVKGILCWTSDGFSCWFLRTKLKLGLKFEKSGTNFHKSSTIFLKI